MLIKRKQNGERNRGEKNIYNRNRNARVYKVRQLQQHYIMLANITVILKKDESYFLNLILK